MSADVRAEFLRGLSALRLEVPAVVWDDFNRRASALLAERDRLQSWVDRVAEISTDADARAVRLALEAGHADAQDVPSICAACREEADEHEVDCPHGIYDDGLAALARLVAALPGAPAETHTEATA